MRLYSITPWLIGMLFAVVSSHAQHVMTAEEVLAPVYAQAKKENKNVLLIYHASWCGWCRKWTRRY